MNNLPKDTENERFEIHATALWALGKEGILDSLFLKESVKRIILQSSETPNWHHTTHYRSLAAGAKITYAIRSGVINSVSSYHNFCCARVNDLCHEHMVPTEVVYKLIIGCEKPSVQAYEDILRGCGFRATILQSEDKRLLTSTLPDLDAFKTLGAPGYYDHQCRYKSPKTGEPIHLDVRPHEGWAVK